MSDKKKLIFPHHVVEAMAKETDASNKDFMLDVFKVRENLSTKANVSVERVERLFSDPISPETIRLKGLIENIKNFKREGGRTAILVTNDPIKVSDYVNALLYVWAMTLKVAVLNQTASELNHKYYSYDEDSTELAEKCGLLCINRFTPMSIKKIAYMSPLSELILNRTNVAYSYFTVLISTSQFDVGSDNIPKKQEEIIGARETIRKQILDCYGRSLYDVLDSSALCSIFMGFPQSDNKSAFMFS